MLGIIDPSIDPKGSKRTWDELVTKAKKLNPEQQLERQARLGTFAVQLLAISIAVMRAHGIDTDQPGYCLDGTRIKLFARGRGKNDVEASTLAQSDDQRAVTDPDGGYYTRTEDHDEDTTSAKVQEFSLDVHTATLSDISDPERMRTVLDPGPKAWRVYADPAGHPFCLVSVPE